MKKELSDRAKQVGHEGKIVPISAWININNSVAVRITELGEEIWNLSMKGVPIKRDENGYSVMQLSVLMRELGPHIEMGQGLKHLPFEPTLGLVDPDYEPGLGMTWGEFDDFIETHGVPGPLCKEDESTSWYEYCRKITDLVAGGVRRGLNTMKL